MSSDVVVILQCVFGPIFSLFTSWHFPGTNVSPAAMAFFLLAAYAILRIIRQNLFDGGDQ